MKLVKMLQKARAAELGAFLAYEGHWKSLSDQEEREAIRTIQRDELEHFTVVSKMLTHLGGKPSWALDAVFTVIGNTLSFLCKYTGWLLPMKGALIFEKIGVNNYYEMIEVALREGHPELCITFTQLLAREEEHQLYFKGELTAIQRKQS